MKKQKKLTARDLRHSDDMDKARARVGDTAESRLKWVLSFKEVDLDALTAGERAAWGDGLRCLPVGTLSHGGRVMQTMAWAYSQDKMDDATLAGLQEWVRDFFKALASNDAGFEYHPPESISVFRTNPLPSKTVQFQVMSKFPFLDKTRAIQYSIVNLVLDGSEKLRFCFQCKAPFIPNRKQDFCKPQCSQKARDIRRGKSYAEA